jgi:hypothetical protein
VTDQATDQAMIQPGLIMVPKEDISKREADLVLGPVRVLNRTKGGAYLMVRTMTTLQSRTFGQRTVQTPVHGVLRRVKEDRLQRLYRFATEQETRDFDAVKVDLTFPNVEVDLDNNEFQLDFAMRYGSDTAEGSKLNQAFCGLSRAQQSLLFVLAQCNDNIAAIARALGRSRQWFYRNGDKLKQALIAKLGGEEIYDTLYVKLAPADKHVLKPSTGPAGANGQKVCRRCHRSGSPREFYSSPVCPGTPEG